MPQVTTILVVMTLLIAASGCSNESTRDTDDSTAQADTVLQVDSHPGPAGPIPPPEPLAALATETGEATFYADTFDRQRTASGELLDQTDMVAAHRRFPFGTVVRVTNLRNDRSVDVRIIDRGPFGAPKVAAEKVIDLSRQAATQLDIIRQVRAVVRVDVLSYGG